MRQLAIGVCCLLAAYPASLPAAEVAFDCRVALLRVNAERFFLRCETSPTGVDVPALAREIPFYSVAFTQTNARYLFELLLEAQSRSRSVRLIVEDDPADNPPGCAERNCRRVIAASIAG